MTLFYVDTSNNQWGGITQNALDFCAQLVPQGFAGIIHKVSEGAYFEDPFWQPVKQWCQSNNLPCLGYHYVTGDDPDAQARTWLANNGGPNAELDWENNGGDLANFWGVVNAFNAAGVNVQLAYAPQWYWNNQGGGDLSALTASGIGLVSSAYPDGTGAASDIYANSGGDTGEGWAPYGTAVPAAWQFTDSASIFGLTVDCNAFKGASIQSLFGQVAVAVKQKVRRKKAA